eukprot:jgi/Picsp_1/1511/NSC_04989-R1_phenylalanine racemase
MMFIVSLGRLGPKSEMPQHIAQDHMMTYQMHFLYVSNDLSLSGQGKTLHDFKKHRQSQRDTTFGWTLQDGEMLQGVLEYRSDKFSPKMPEYFLQQYIKLLTTVMSLSTSLSFTPIQDFDILTEEEKQELNFFASRGGTYNRLNSTGPLVHHAFEQAAARHPDKVCLVFEGVDMTYGEVNSKANRLASLLISKGVGLGSVVGIMLHRSFELVISILAALKTGAGYLPCDPDDPDDRLAIYMEDAGASIVLSQGSEMARAYIFSQEGFLTEDTNAL